MTLGGTADGFRTTERANCLCLESCPRKRLNGSECFDGRFGVPRSIEITDHLILPFGRARKDDLERIKLSAVAANGIYLTTDVPCVYINVAKKEPLTISDFYTVLGGSDPEPDGGDLPAALDFIHGRVLKHMPGETTTRYERTFLDLYFGWLKGRLKRLREPYTLYNALLPIPQMQLYVHDPLEDDDIFAFEPSNNFRVDFGFWTGANLVAVEIDGNEPAGYARDLRRDRLLRRANVDVVHILNTEIDRHEQKVVWSLLPRAILDEWERMKPPSLPPLGLWGPTVRQLNS